ncbi:MAG: HAD family hydrolase [Candidatus Bipolaricaulota bacterium]
MVRATTRDVIWDFNGTLIDDVDLTVASVNVLLARRGLPQLQRDRYLRVFGFPLEDYYRSIGLDLAKESLAGLADEFHDAYEPGLAGCSLQRGVADVVRWFCEAGSRQFVLSALEEGVLRRSIAALGLGNAFRGIYGLAHRLADSKVARGLDLVREHNLRSSDALLIGDTNHDADVASALGISVALVAQGHQSLDRLAELGVDTFPDFGALLFRLRSTSGCPARVRRRRA